jgi:hypothetical protein
MNTLLINEANTTYESAVSEHSGMFIIRKGSIQERFSVKRNTRIKRVYK